MTDEAMPQPKRLHYAWVVVGVSFTVMLVAAGMRATSSVMMVPWEAEFGWSRAAISFPIAIQLMMFGLVGPFSAAFIDRFGLRRTMLVCLSLMVIGMAPLPLISASWQLLPILGISMCLSVGALSMVLAAIVSSRWFVARRGLVMGLLSGASAAGQLIFIPSLAQLVAHFGWRPAVLIGGATLLLIIPRVAIFMRETPAAMGLQPYGAKHDAPPATAPTRVNPI